MKKQTSPRGSDNLLLQQHKSPPTHCTDLQAIISTVLVSLSLSTAALGLALVGLGRLRLASLVQYLPMPVVGGYLAFIGFFCGQVIPSIPSVRCFQRQPRPSLSIFPSLSSYFFFYYLCFFSFMVFMAPTTTNVRRTHRLVSRSWLRLKW
jgi:hypothetical protein